MKTKVKSMDMCAAGDFYSAPPRARTTKHLAQHFAEHRERAEREALQSASEEIIKLQDKADDYEKVLSWYEENLLWPQAMKARDVLLKHKEK